MHVEDARGALEAEDEASLEAALAVRYDHDANEFWLYGGDGPHPTLGILVRGDLADVHYLPSEGHPGFRSLATQESKAEGTTTFYMGGEQQAAPNQFVVPFSKALEAAKEFLVSRQQPMCLDWFEL
jgi:hypothetical protein